MKKQSGLTLIELMVTMAVLAVLIAVGAPKLQNMSAGNKLTTAVNQLSGDFSAARNAAGNRDSLITINSKNGTDWSQGWQILDGATVIGDVTGIPAQLTITGTVATLTFRTDGALTTTAALEFTACDPSLSGKPNKVVEILGVTGRHRLTTTGSCP